MLLSLICKYIWLINREQSYIKYDDRLVLLQKNERSLFVQKSEVHGNPCPNPVDMLTLLNNIMIIDDTKLALEFNLYTC